MHILSRDFYRPDPVSVAKRLLGCCLVRKTNDKILKGLISETEAYQGEEDLGCHAHNGKTPRNAIMYGPPGYAYIYFTYGKHWLLNAVVGEVGFPAAVLIRALVPVNGKEIMKVNRPNQANKTKWLDGPAKLTQALILTGEFNGSDLCSFSSPFYIIEGVKIEDEKITKGSRIGLNNVPEPWKSIPWNFRVNLQGYSC